MIFGAPLRVARRMRLLPKRIGPRKRKMKMEMVAGATLRQNKRGRTRKVVRTQKVAWTQKVARTPTTALARTEGI
jgi:hypothetical protein